MTVLPIVERELSVRSRQAPTYYLRALAAGLAMALTGAYFLVWTKSGAANMVGQQLLISLTFLAFLACLFEGCRNTSDCLSSERREGTIGLLFLTDLKSRDIILGKLVATSLQSFYSLAAIVPVFALVFLAGGVTGGEVWRVSLALINTLFFTSAAGLWISSRSEDEQKAMFGTLGLVILVTGGLPLFELLLNGGNYNIRTVVLSLGSPAIHCVQAFDVNYRANPSQYWLAWLAVHGLGWGWLGLAALSLKNVLHADPNLSSEVQPVETTRSADRSSGHLAAKVPIDHPFMWLSTRHGSRLDWIWILVILSLATSTGNQLLVNWLGSAGRTVPSYFTIVSLLNLVIFFALRLEIAALACRFFVQARTTGFLELILTCPVSRDEILKSQWAILRRNALRPLLWLMAMQAGLVLAWFLIDSDSVRGMRSTRFVMSALSQVVTLLGTFFSLSWVGMWMAYSSPKPGLAVFKTFAFVVLLPWMFCTMMPFGYLVFRAVPFMVMFQPALASLIKDLIFIVWARSRMRSQFLEASGSALKN